MVGVCVGDIDDGMEVVVVGVGSDVSFVGLPVLVEFGLDGDEVEGCIHVGNLLVGANVARFPPQVGGAWMKGVWVGDIVPIAVVVPHPWVGTGVDV